MPDTSVRKYIGLCTAAGGVRAGVSSVLDDVRRGKSRLVIISTDISERSRKQIRDKCAFYGVPAADSSFTSAELGQMTGKSPTSALSFTGKGCYNKIKEYYLKEDTQTGEYESKQQQFKSKKSSTMEK